MDKHTIIKLKKEGYSNRQVAKLLSINRKTVGRYRNEYNEQLDLLVSNTADAITTIQENICAPPAYNFSNRSWRKYTQELDTFIDQILENESEKCKLLGTRKQQPTGSKKSHINFLYTADFKHKKALSAFLQPKVQFIH